MRFAENASQSLSDRTTTANYSRSNASTARLQLSLYEKDTVKSQ
jgi:hypothetical protein